MSETSQLQKLQEIFKLQDSFNAKVNPQWKKQGFPFYRAAYREMDEFAEHVGMWKWWKAGVPGDREQAVLELVDIFHFLVSDLIVRGRDPQFVIGSYKRAASRPVSSEIDYVRLHDQIDNFIAMTIVNCTLGATVGIPTKEFFDVCYIMGVTLDELIAKYIGKNVLNVFRQDKGYKIPGEYVKVWGKGPGNVDLEDNHFLVEFRNELGDSLTFDGLYSKLEQKYAEVLSTTHQQ